MPNAIMLICSFRFEENELLILTKKLYFLPRNCFITGDHQDPQIIHLAQIVLLLGSFCIYYFILFYFV
jgi:hypothetical protein